MTREAFIRKWLANKDFQYCEDGRAQMREDLDKVIYHAHQKLNIASVVRPEVESAKEGELLPVEGLAKSVSGGFIFECEKCGEQIQWPVTSTICEKCG